MVSALKAIAWRRVAFLFPVSLAVALFLFGARLDLSALSPPLLAVNALLALMSAGFATAILIIVPWGLRRLWRIILSQVAVFAVKSAIKASSRKVTATGIGSRDGELVVSLSAGIQDGIARGSKFLATTATGEPLGMVECFEVSETSCLCAVFVMLNADFWAGLDARKGRDPSPPLGVEFTGYIPENFLVELQRLLKQWEVDQ